MAGPEIVIWWDWTNNPAKPWRYEVFFYRARYQGDCDSLANCWREIDAHLSTFVIQDNQPVRRTHEEDSPVH